MFIGVRRHNLFAKILSIFSCSIGQYKKSIKDHLIDTIPGLTSRGWNLTLHICWFGDERFSSVLLLQYQNTFCILFVVNVSYNSLFLAATKQLYEWFSPYVCLSVCLSVCHTFLTMFPSSYHHEIFRTYYQWQKWRPCKRSRSEIKGQGHRALEIVGFDPDWAFPDCNSSLNSPMGTKWCTKLEVTLKRCPIVFQGHPSNFQVTRL